MERASAANSPAPADDGTGELAGQLHRARRQCHQNTLHRRTTRLTERSSWLERRVIFRRHQKGRISFGSIVCSGRRLSNWQTPRARTTRPFGVTNNEAPTTYQPHPKFQTPFLKRGPSRIGRASRTVLISPLKAGRSWSGESDHNNRLSREQSELQISANRSDRPAAVRASGGFISRTREQQTRRDQPAQDIPLRT